MQMHDADQVLYTPTDLVAFLGCRHATYLEVKHLQQALNLAKAEPDATSQLLAQKGIAHEETYLQALKEQGKTVVAIPKQGLSLQGRADLTSQALQAGVDAVYQGVLYQAPWRGDADFLIKCNTASALGPCSYEVLDTKLAKTAEPKHMLQISLYSDLLSTVQGHPAETMHLVLGDGQRHSFRVADYEAYYRHAKQRFEAFVQNLPESSAAEPCQHCGYCPWKDHCTHQWHQDNHLSLVANIQRSHIDTLRQAGIHGVAALAAVPQGTQVPGLNREVLERLRSQAALQTHKAQTGEDRYEILPFPPGKGFERLPHPNSGDLFFDMEGDPLYPGGLEYLFGVYFQQAEERVFRPFWAHNHAEEKETFRDFMAFLGEHLSQYPEAHIYHYNHYETTALKRLACRYAIGEEQLDNLLRQQKFVDLYVVVRESIRTSEPGYSIKNLETFYMQKRDNAVTNAADSIIVYNEWRITGDADQLQAIADYNKVDCISTQLLRDWLITLKPADSPWFSREISEAETDDSLRKDWEIEYEAYQARLLAESTVETTELHERLSYLLEFHNREAKPQWWAMFDRTRKLDDELIEDAECLAGLWLEGEPYPEKRSLVYTYRFPPQESKLKVGSEVLDAITLEKVGSIASIDDEKNLIHIKRGKTKPPLPKGLHLGPPGPISAKPIRSAIYRFANGFLDSPNAHQCIRDLLSRARPRILGKPPEEPIITSTDILQEALEAVAHLDHSYLFIQGPPGAGKTYTSSHIIAELLRRGARVGVASNSHKAIHNLLDGIEAAAAERNITFQGIKKSSDGNLESIYESKHGYIQNEGKVDGISLDVDLFAGTAWFFAHERLANHLDYLFIDEAGQVALANVVAMGTSTRNLVLVGDQMQLGQPIQGTHPGDAGLSVLEFLLGNQATIPPDRGIFLDNTRRLDPSICQFISEAFYDGRLSAHTVTQQRRLLLDKVNLPSQGILYYPVDHDGCSQKSVEEGDIIQAHYQALLGQRYRDVDGTVRPITEADILVVAPYNVQVNYLRSRLPHPARVGTVDKFQGQEAPVVLISMVTSGAEYLPRNIEFLYSPNRLNVALSRAQCLAIVVFNPKLLEIPCTTLDQMKLANTFCRLREYAGASALRP